MENEDNVGILGDGKWQLLKAIRDEGSLKGAIEKQKLSYRKTWGNLKKIEKLLGFPLIKPSRGGNEKGNTVLTKEGYVVVEAFDSFHREFDEKIQTAFQSMMEKLKAEM